jgi:hypothetical protein
VRRSRTAGEFSGTDESSLSKWTLNETARRGPSVRGGGHGDGSPARYSRQIAPVITNPTFIRRRVSPCNFESKLSKLLRQGVCNLYRVTNISGCCRWNPVAS